MNFNIKNKEIKRRIYDPTITYMCNKYNNTDWKREIKSITINFTEVNHKF